MSFAKNKKIKRRKTFLRSSGEVDFINNTLSNVKKYHNSSLNNTYYLGYRDIPNLLHKYKVEKKAIDYGCGTGRSTRFLHSLGYDAMGVDISSKMLAQASLENDSLHYVLIKNSQIPVLDATYDLFFSCFVFFVIPTIDELMSIFKEAYRCLKKGGFFIFITGSEYLYSLPWWSDHQKVLAFSGNRLIGYDKEYPIKVWELRDSSAKN